VLRALLLAAFVAMTPGIVPVDRLAACPAWHRHLPAILL
jgi:hypothetical protein